MVDVNTVVENTSIATSIKDKTLYQFKGKTNLEKILGIFAKELQELESNAVIPLLDERLLRVSTGDLLDKVGEILGVERRGLSDNPYRSLLYLKLFQRSNRGTYQNILDIVSYSFGDESVIMSKGIGYDLDINVTFCSELGVIDDYTRDILIAGLLESLPVLTSARVLEKSDTPFGFLGNPYALGYGAVGKTGGGLMSRDI